MTEPDPTDTTDTPDEQAEQPDRYPELAALVAEREAEEARRWTVVAAIGLAAVLASTFLPWWVADAAAAVVADTTPPPLVWVGLVPAALALAIAVVLPHRFPFAPPAVVVLGALLAAAGCIGAAGHDWPGAAPWLGLCGALAATTSALAGLAAANAAQRASGS